MSDLNSIVLGAKPAIGSMCFPWVLVRSSKRAPKSAEYKYLSDSPFRSTFFRVAWLFIGICPQLHGFLTVYDLHGFWTVFDLYSYPTEFELCGFPTVFVLICMVSWLFLLSFMVSRRHLPWVVWFTDGIFLNLHCFSVILYWIMWFRDGIYLDLCGFPTVFVLLYGFPMAFLYNWIWSVFIVMVFDRQFFSFRWFLIGIYLSYMVSDLCTSVSCYIVPVVYLNCVTSDSYLS